jgi:hypothetical protein
MIVVAKPADSVEVESEVARSRLHCPLPCELPRFVLRGLRALAVQCLGPGQP